MCETSDSTYKIYQKCYEIDSDQVPIHFLHWADPRRMSADSIVRIAVDYIGSTDWLFAYEEGIILAYHYFKETADLSEIEEACGLSMEQVRSMETLAVRKMKSRLGVRNPYNSQPGGRTLM